MWIWQKHFNFWDSPAKMLTVGTNIVVLYFASVIGMSVTCSDQSILNKVLSVSVLRSFGKYSYAIYVFHASIIELLGPVVFHDEKLHDFVSLSNSVFMAILTVGCSYLTARVSWHVWESLFLKLKRYFPLSGRVSP